MFIEAPMYGRIATFGQTPTQNLHGIKIDQLPLHQWTGAPLEQLKSRLAKIRSNIHLKLCVSLILL